MSNSIAPGSSADVNVRVTALTTNLNVPVTYKTIILKKNLVNGVNTLTQEMISATNTKYVIKYDYVLGENITIPTNCILEFDGGSLKNGTIEANNAYFKGVSPNTSVYITGDFSYDTIDSFGVSPQNTAAENDDALEHFNHFKTNDMLFGYGCYNFNNPIVLKNDACIIGKGVGTVSDPYLLAPVNKGTTLHFPNNGIEFDGKWIHGCVYSDFMIESDNGHCVNLMKDVHHDYLTSMSSNRFERLTLHAPNGSCFIQEKASKYVYANIFKDCNLFDSIYGFKNCSLSINTILDSLHDDRLEYYFYNCWATEGGATCIDMGAGTGGKLKHFIFTDAEYLVQDLNMINRFTLNNCYFEELISSIFVVGLDKPTSGESHYLVNIICNDCVFNTMASGATKSYRFDMENKVFVERDLDNYADYRLCAGYRAAPVFNGCHWINYRPSDNPVYIAEIHNDNKYNRHFHFQRINFNAEIINDTSTAIIPVFDEDTVIDISKVAPIVGGYGFYTAWYTELYYEGKRTIINTSDDSYRIIAGDSVFWINKGMRFEIEQYGYTQNAGTLYVTSNMYPAIQSCGVGFRIVYTDTGKEMVWNGESYSTIFPMTVGDVRPDNWIPNDAGRPFYDRSIGMIMYWTGDTENGKSGWMNALGGLLQPVRYVLENMGYSGKLYAIQGESFRTVLTADEGYSLPTWIRVYMGTEQPIDTSAYTYDSSTGELVILGFGGTGGVTASIAISAEGVPNQ